MPQAIQNAKQILVGGAGAAGTTTDNLNGAAFRANTGEVGIFSPNGVRIANAGAAVAGQKFVLALSRGAGQAPLTSDVIDGSQVRVASVRDNVAATEQVDIVGYNGTSGSIADVATFAGDLYILNIIFQDLMVGTDAERFKKAVYQSSISDTQADIAIGLAKSAYNNMSRDVKNTAGDAPVAVHTICNNAGAIIPTGAGTVAVTKNSKTIVFSTDVADTTGAAILTVGEYLRFGTTTSDPVYKIVSIDVPSESIVLDRPYTGATNAAIANNAVERITAALGAAADWGIVVSGKETNFDRVKSRYAKIRFELQPNESFGSTVVTKSVRAFEGVGAYEAIASLEDFLNTYRGEEFRMGEPFLFDFRAQHLANPATDYSILNIQYNHVKSGFSNEISPKEIIVAVPTGIPDYADASADSINDILDVICAGKIKGDSVATTLEITV